MGSREGEAEKKRRIPEPSVLPSVPLPGRGGRYGTERRRRDLGGTVADLSAPEARPELNPARRSVVVRVAMSPQVVSTPPDTAPARADTFT